MIEVGRYLSHVYQGARIVSPRAEYESLDFYYRTAATPLPYLPAGAFFYNSSHKVKYDSAERGASLFRHMEPVKLSHQANPSTFSSGTSTTRSGPQPSWTSPTAVCRYIFYPNGFCPDGTRKLADGCDTVFDLEGHPQVESLFKLRAGSYVEVQQNGGWLRQPRGLWYNIWRGTGVFVRLAKPFVALSKVDAAIDMILALSKSEAEDIAWLLHLDVKAIAVDSTTLQEVLAYLTLYDCPCCESTIPARAAGSAKSEMESWLTKMRKLPPRRAIAAFRSLTHPHGGGGLSGATRFSIFWSYSACSSGHVARAHDIGINVFIGVLACLTNVSSVVFAASPNDNGLLHQELVDYEGLLEDAALTPGSKSRALACRRSLESRMLPETDNAVWERVAYHKKFSNDALGTSMCTAQYGTARSDEIVDAGGKDSSYHACWLHCTERASASLCAETTARFPRQSVQKNATGSWWARQPPALDPAWPRQVLTFGMDTRVPGTTISDGGARNRGGSVSGKYATDGWRYFTALSCAVPKEPAAICLFFKNSVAHETWLGGLWSRDGVHFQSEPTLVLPAAAPFMTHNTALLQVASGAFVAIGGQDKYGDGLGTRSVLLPPPRPLVGEVTERTGLWLVHGQTWSFAHRQAPMHATKDGWRIEGVDTARVHTQWSTPRHIFNGSHPGCVEGRRHESMRDRDDHRLSMKPQTLQAATMLNAPPSTGATKTERKAMRQKHRQNTKSALAMANSGRPKACSFDGRLSLVEYQGRWLLFARANPASAGERFVQVTASDDRGVTWGEFELISIQDYFHHDGNIYFFAVSSNPVDPASLVAFFPLSHGCCGYLAMAWSRDGVHWTHPFPIMHSALDALDLGHRTRDHPVAGIVRRGNYVWIYVHRNVPANVERTSSALAYNLTMLRSVFAPQVVRHDIPVSVFEEWSRRALSRLTGQHA